MTAGNLEDDLELRELFAEHSRELYRSAAPVSEWPIVAWCRALGDNNPVYRDGIAARHYGHGGIIAPPVMMHAFTMPGVFSPQTGGLLAKLRQRLARDGLNSVLAASYEQEFLAPIHLGDRLTRIMRFESISDERTTSAGVGRFVVMAEEIVNQTGRRIGSQKLRTLFFAPPPAGRKADGDGQARPAAPGPESEDRILLPPLSIPLTTTLIVAAALASNDFEPIHHDRDAAQAQGLKDIVMNVLTSTGLAMRYVTDWAGPATTIRRISTRLKAPNYPGDTMTLTGWVEKSYRPGQAAEIHIHGSNAIGGHIESVIAING